MANTTNTTIGTTIGRAIGASAAYVGHGAIQAASYTGQFGRDVVAGTREGYQAKASELAAARAGLGYTPVKRVKPRAA